MSLETPGSAIELSRRQFLAASLAVGLAAAIGNSLPAAAQSAELAVVEHSTGVTGQELEVYMPTWLSADEYKQLQVLPGLKNINRIIGAFAIPKSASKLSVPVISPELKDLLTTVPDTKFGLSIGGWGATPEQHTSILGAWDDALAKPKLFSKRALAAAHEVGADYIDLDMEYPSVAQALTFMRLAHTLRETLPDQIGLSTTMAPAATAEAYVGSLAFGKHGLQTAIDTFHVLTYDHNGPWSETSGYGAPGTWTINCISEWVKKVGDPAQISVGYPTYGYVFEGATQPGQKFTSSSEVEYSQVPAGSPVQEYPGQLTSFAMINGSWVTLQSPADLAETQAKIRAQYPDIGGAFLWSAGDGIVAADIRALDPKK
jgi:GH18 family chitinase